MHDAQPTGILDLSNNHTGPTAPIRPVGAVSEQTSQIQFVFPSSKRKLSLSLDDELKIGRSDAGHAYFPEVDLTQEKGMENGVSRLHASIKKTDKTIVLIDRESTNGTLLNKRHLAPNTAYPLRDGDEILFGTLLVQIYFES